MAGREENQQDDQHYEIPQEEKPARAARQHSKRARHPIVIIGNAIFTILLLLSVVVGGGVYYGSQRFGAAGPLAENVTVNIPPRTGLRDMADLLQLMVDRGASDLIRVRATAWTSSTTAIRCTRR